MILSDTTIRSYLSRGELRIDPIEPDAQVQPASVDLRLGNHFLVLERHKVPYIDPFLNEPRLYTEYEVDNGDVFTLHPNQLVLATTAEEIELPSHLVGRVDGKSSLGRLGLLVHSTAGFVDPGFHGQITLELSNVAGLPIGLRPGMFIAQISFMIMDRDAERPYGHPDRNSKYQGQRGATVSQYAQNSLVAP